MIELRIVRNSNNEDRLQMRCVPLEIGWLQKEDRPVIQPQKPIFLTAARNWSEWKDVSIVFEDKLEAGE